VKFHRERDVEVTCVELIQHIWWLGLAELDRHLRRLAANAFEHTGQESSGGVANQTIITFEVPRNAVRSGTSTA